MMVDPSGDQVGPPRTQSDRLELFDASVTAFPPPASVTTIDVLAVPACHRRKAMRRPSGENAGTVSVSSPSVKRRRSVPSARTVKISFLDPSTIVSSIEPNARTAPSPRAIGAFDESHKPTTE